MTNAGILHFDIVYYESVGKIFDFGCTVILTDSRDLSGRGRANAVAGCNDLERHATLLGVCRIFLLAGARNGRRLPQGYFREGWAAGKSG